MNALFLANVNSCSRSLYAVVRSSVVCLSSAIYLNICMNCIIFTSKTPQILTIQFRLLRNS